MLQRRPTTTTNTQPPPNIEPIQLSIINELPIEILTKIFIWCLSELGLFVTPTATEAPLLLCSVCRLWRNVAISTPPLWCSMKLTNNLSPKLVTGWLSRARAGPLSIGFALDSGSVQANLPFRPKRLPILMDAIIQLADRWKSLKITISPRAPLRLLNKLSKEALPSLETLVVRYPQGTSTYDRCPLDHIFQSSSQLRQVFIFGDDSTISMSMLRNLPSSHIKILCTDSLLYPEECICLLSLSHEIEQGFFRLAHWSFQVPLPLPSKSVLLKDMETLSLQTFTSLAGIFTILTLPALRFLKIGFGRRDSWSHEAFLSFISPFSSTLCTLRLDNPPVSEGKLIEYLRHLPSLTELGLRDRPEFDSIGDCLVGALTYREDDDEGTPTYLCPKLEKLELFGVHTCGDKCLVNMLESRWRQRAPVTPEIKDDFVSLGPIIHFSLESVFLNLEAGDRYVACQRSQGRQLSASQVFISGSGVRDRLICHGGWAP
jgi:hypothetical protein